MDNAIAGRSETMDLKRQYFKQAFFSIIVGLFYLSLICYHSIGQTTTSNLEDRSNILDHDLRLTRTIEVDQRIQTINLQSSPLYLPKPNYLTFALFEVQNYGDELKKITVVLNAGMYQWEEVFQRKETLVDYCYDFAEKTELFIPLKGLATIPPPIMLQIFLTLEYYPQLQDPSAQFSLHKTSLRQVTSVSESHLLIFPAEFQLAVPNRTYSFETAHFTLASYYLTNLTTSERLSALVELKTEVPARVLESSEVNQLTNPAGNLTGFEVVMNTNLTKQRVCLEIEGMTSGRSYPVSLKLHSTEIQQKYPSILQGSFPTHPIPSWVMMPFWMLVLFGVPIAYLFREKND